MKTFFDRVENSIHCSPVLRLAAMVGVALVLYTVFSLMVHRIDRTLPIKGAMKIEALNSPITVGQNLQVKVTRDKVRNDCPVTSLRYVTTPDGVAHDIPDRAWEGGKKGSEDILTYPTSGLPPGQYTLHVSLSYACPGFTWNRDQPTVSFRVQPK